MKFKHFTMEELRRMTQDQQRGYLLQELTIGFGRLLAKGVEDEPIKETATAQLGRINYLKGACKQFLELLHEAMVGDTAELEIRLQKAVDAPKALNYK